MPRRSCLLWAAILLAASGSSAILLGSQQVSSDSRGTLNGLRQRVDAWGARLEQLATACRAEQLRVRAERREGIRKGISGGGNAALADDVLTQLAEQERAETMCCAEVRQAMEDRRALRDGLLSIVAAVDASADLVSRRSSLDDEARTLENRIADLRRQRDLIDARNRDSIIAILRESDFFGTPQIPDVLDAYLKNPAFHVRIEHIDVLITPFGYFKYEPVIELIRGSAQPTISFHPLDLFQHDTVLQAYREVVQRPVLRLSASVSGPAGELTVTPEGFQDRDVDFRTPAEWAWTLRRPEWLRLFHKTYSTRVEVQARYGQTSARGLPAIDAIRVESDGRLSKLWTWVDALGTLYGLVPLATGILGFLVGRKAGGSRTAGEG